MTDSPKVLTAAEVAEIRARADKATPGPWKFKESDGRDCIWLDVVHGEEEDEIACGETQDHTPSTRKQEVINDLVHIASARTDVPALCDAVEPSGRIGTG